MAQQRKWFTFGMALVITLSMLLASCSSATQTPVATESTGASTEEAAAPEEQAGESDDVLTIAVSADISGWDPVTSIYWLANEVI
ncbi:MAG: hypothetical protein EHM41_11375, partial [Chloroflexi bacterium]